jgi:hypothetical protein
MPTVVIRPDGTTSETGWDVSNIHTVIGDQDLSTKATQTNTTCNFTVTLGNLSIDGASTINSITATFRGVAGRTGSTTVTVKLIHSGVAFGQETKTITTDANYNYSAVTTQADGSTALTVAYVNALSLIIAPGTSGVTAKDVFVTIDYDLPPVLPIYDTTVNNLHITSGNVSVQSDNIFI